MIRFKHNPVDKIDISSPFGPRTNPITGVEEEHLGIDLKPKARRVDGDSLYAVDDGKLIISKCNQGGIKKGYGYYSVIQHNGFATLYAHQRELSFALGQVFKAGNVIGHMGTTGASTGTHLHFEVYEGNYYDKKRVDPAKFLLKEGEVAEVVRKIKIKQNGVIKEVDAINVESTEFVQLRDLEDPKTTVDYDKIAKMPVITNK